MSWKHRPWKPDLDTMEDWRSFAGCLLAMAVAVALLWGSL